jgi:8-oxo-dGTP pyrophosphatase MutT (NUDIX family)
MSDPILVDEVRPAATILLLRDDPELEVLMVQRHHRIDFAPGALVFPGGKAHAGDEDAAWADHALGWDGFSADQRSLRIAAIREAFEEAGVLLARRRDGGAIGGEACPLEVRQAVDRGETAFLDVVRDLDAQLDLDAIKVFARWITPKLSDKPTKRYDTWFFVAEAPVEQLAACDGHETVDALWIPPKEALRLGQAGERKVVFPTRLNLQLLAESDGAGAAVARAAARTLVTVEPALQERPHGPVLVLPPDAGYGVVEEPLSAVLS